MPVRVNFPSQSDMVETSVTAVTNLVAARPDTLVIVGAYTIGKERIFKAIVEALDANLWAENKRVATWNCLSDQAGVSRRGV